MRQIVLDTETTGLDWKNGDRVIEIGCVELVDRKLTGRHYHVYINPQRAIDAGAVAVHGITDEFLADKPKFKDVAADFEVRRRRRTGDSQRQLRRRLSEQRTRACWAAPLRRPSART
jgi:DNA polymerase III epsilon subunit-like protein